MRTALAVLVLLLTALPVHAALMVCNRTPHETRVALGYFDGAAWSSEGWWTVAPKACEKLLAGPLDSRYYYLYATDGGTGSWDGKNGFCVAATDKFAIHGRADCAAQGYDRKGFFEIDTGQARDYTQILSD
ncbi:MAG: DUF1036 domain-containing protein [Rhizomicrobium sp.]